MINSLVDERAMVLTNRKVSDQEEKKWLKANLIDIKGHRLIDLVAEVDGKIVGNCELRYGYGREKHVGYLAVIVMRGYRGLSIGSRLITKAIAYAKKYGIRLVLLDVFLLNKKAVKLYKKFGFREVGRVPQRVRYNNKYETSIIMAKSLY